jgi:hypothetical protein
MLPRRQPAPRGCLETRVQPSHHHQLLGAFLQKDEQQALRALHDERRGQYQAGRQETGYMKLPLRDEPQLVPLVARSLAVLETDVDSPLWDAYLLFYPAGSAIPAHTDPAAPDHTHHRLNALVIAPPSGGALALLGQVVPLFVGDAVVFRPDEVKHEVSAVVGGERLVWSVGCWRPRP